MNRSKKEQKEILKNVVAISGVGIGVLLILISSILFIKSKIANNDIQDEAGEVQKIADDYESTSTEMGRTVEEVKKDEEEDINISRIENIISENNTSKNESENKVEETKIQEIKKEDQTINNNVKEEEKDINFIAPVKGEIIRDFALESLVYSDTLKEWITHKGIDIKADKTTVVVAACEGTVQSIKNDPRYGLTVIINHDGGYQTVYSNLLTAEFVVEGENVSEGQTIGTIGNSASFEINDSYHLHFELLKNNEYQDPKIYIDI